MATYSHDPPSSAATDAPTGTYGAVGGTLTITSWGEQITGSYEFDAMNRASGTSHEVRVSGGFLEIDLP